MTTKRDTEQDGGEQPNEKERASALAKVQRLFDDASKALEEFQTTHTHVGSWVPEPGPEGRPDISHLPDADRIAIEKQWRHADAVESGDMTYKDISDERIADWQAAFDAFPDADRAALNDWAVRREAQHGDPLGVFNHVAAPWPLTFLAARYGDEVSKWPTSLSNDDRLRLRVIDTGVGRALRFVEPLHTAMAAKAIRKRVHLFGHEAHVAAKKAVAADTKSAIAMVGAVGGVLAAPSSPIMLLLVAAVMLVSSYALVPFGIETGVISLGGGALPWRTRLRRLKEILTVWASALTDAAEVEIIKHYFRTGSITKPTQLTTDLYTATPGEAGGGTIVTGGSYAGVRLDPLDANWAATSGTDGLTSNSSAVTFPAPTANWGVVTSFSETDQTAMKWYGALTVSKTVNNADAAPVFAIGALQFTVA